MTGVDDFGDLGVVAVAAALTGASLVLLLTSGRVAGVGRTGIGIGVGVTRAGGGDGTTGLLDLVDDCCG